MRQAPELSVLQIEQEVARIFQRDHRSTLVALFGRGEAGTFAHGAKRWQVVPARCELQLRELLPGPEEAEVRKVYLVDWAEELPLDIRCRLAGARVYHVAPDARLLALFGARALDPQLPHSALAAYFLEHPTPAPRKLSGLRLTLDEAWLRFLEREKVPLESISSLGALLAWAATHDGGPAFARRTQANLRAELGAWMESRLGAAGELLWAAWAAGEAAALLEVLPLLTAAEACDDAGLKGQLKGQLSAWLPALAGRLRYPPSELLEDAVLSEALGQPQNKAALSASQARAEEAGLEALSALSRWLPGGHRARQQALAQAVQACLKAPSRAAATQVVEALTQLKAQALDLELPAEHKEARDSLGRLACWLGSAPQETALGDRPAAALAARYVEEGGHLSWARQQLRRLQGADPALLAAAKALGAVVDAAAREADRAFAPAYLRWVAEGKTGAQLTPIEAVSARIVAPFLSENPERKLLVILMDGMSQAVAVQLLSRLEETRRWAPICWRPKESQVNLQVPPVMAAAPSITKLSRGAFFAGEAQTRFGDEATSRDPARWAENPALKGLHGGTARQLFLRSGVMEDAALSDNLRAAIESDDRAVAVVLNAIDEDLSGSQQVAKDYRAAPIQPLEDLISLAEGEERVVLLASDHGHIIGSGARTLEGRMTGPRGAQERREGGARWRPLAEGEAPAPEELLLPEGCWVPEGWAKVAALWDPSVVNHAAKYGEHGGLSLAELVAPAVLIAPSWLAQNKEDPALKTQPLQAPLWWDLEPGQTAAPAQAQGPQVSLPFAAAAPKPPAGPDPLIAALKASKLFKAQTEGEPEEKIARVLSGLSIIARAGDRISTKEFSRQAKTRPHRVPGLIAEMGLLNCDGYAMVEHNRRAGEVLLHRETLTRQYELTP